jgi:hypothetical protein
MNARQVHAVLAAGIENPALIARWRDQPELLRGHGVEPATVDLDGLWKFAGLTVKVRHNALREDMPLTFRLMSVAGIEIDVFAAYAGERAARGARFAATTEGRTLDLIAFLDGWLDREDPVHALLWDVIRHERALAQLARSPYFIRPPRISDSADPSLRYSGASGLARCSGLRSVSAKAVVAPAGAAGRRATATARTVPRVCGEIVLHEMTCNPRAVAAALHASAPRLGEIPRGPVHVCYWRAGAAPEIAILELDALGFYTLSLADGRRTAAALHRALGGIGRPSAGFLRVLGELAALGVISLGSSGSLGRQR